MKKSIQDPVHMYTSGSLRYAAYSGWYSALGDEKPMKQWQHQAHEEWIKEVSGYRKYDFMGRYNHDMYEWIKPERMKDLVNEFLKKIKKEIKIGKSKGLTGKTVL